MIFPDNLNVVNFSKTYRFQPEKWKEAIFEICEDHDIPFVDFRPYTSGSNLIASVGEDLIVKIFPPFHRHQWTSEYMVLNHLQDKLIIAIPKLIVHGERADKWTYVVLSKLQGTTLENIWGNCTEQEKAGFLKHIGSIMAEVHAISIEGIKTLPPDWNHFIADQINRCKARHTRLGMPDWFLTDLDHFIKNTIDHLLENPKMVILTGEYTPFNLMVEGSPGNWNITGMIDFGDSMIGYKEYDLLGPLSFLCEGKPDLIKTLLTAYGYRSEDLNPMFRKRLLLLLILHRYSDLKEQIKIPGWLDKVHNMDELEQIIWPI